jgi:flagellar biosynthesis/type III secretory pathway chaperone
MSINLALFNQDLLHEISIMEQFLEIVIKEQSILASNDIDALEDLLQVKSDLMSALLIVNNNRLSSLAKFGFPDKNSSMALLIKQCNNVTLEQYWQQLINIGTQADEVNKNNGYIVNGLFSTNQNTLAFLQGKNMNVLYGPDGHNTAHSTLRT